MTYLSIRLAAAALMLGTMALISVVDRVIDKFNLSDKIGE